MKIRIAGIIVLGTFALMACGQPAGPAVLISAGTSSQNLATPLSPEQQDTVAVFEQAVTDIQAAQALVASGSAPPVDDQGQSIDLAALVTTYQDTIAEYRHQQASTPLTAQSDAAFVRTYRDDNFKNNYLNDRHYMPNYDWSQDGCSGPATKTGYADNFYWPCVQHDFGYRNNRRARMHNEWTRYDIDVSFLRHMDNLCAHYGVFAKVPCYSMSTIFYKGVRYGAWSAFY